MFLGRELVISFRLLDRVACQLAHAISEQRQYLDIKLTKDSLLHSASKFGVKVSVWYLPRIPIRFL